MRKLTFALLVLPLALAAAWADDSLPMGGAQAVVLSLTTQDTAAGADVLDAVKTPAAQWKACYDVRCEWISQCRVAAPGWTDTYKSKVCLTSCGYWYDTGQKCCWTTQPGTC